MTALVAALPVGEAVFGLLQDDALQAATKGRVYDSLPEDPVRPCVWIEIFNESDRRGMGPGNMPEIELRTHVFSESGSNVEAQRIAQLIIALLKDVELSLSAAGFAPVGGIVYHETLPLTDQALNGIRVHELVSRFTIWVEQV